MMDQELSTVNIELEMLREKVYNLERTINVMAFKRSQAEVSHIKEIDILQERINGGLNVLPVV